jgi:hypothetical protein
MGKQDLQFILSAKLRMDQKPAHDERLGRRVQNNQPDPSKISLMQTTTTTTMTKDNKNDSNYNDDAHVF